MTEPITDVYIDQWIKEKTGGGTSPLFREVNGQLYMWDAEQGRFVPAPGMPSTSERSTIKVEHADGSVWLHDSQTGQPIVQLTEPEPVKNYGYVERPVVDPTNPSRVIRVDKVPIVETTMKGNVLYGRAEGDTQFQPLQEFPTTPAAGPQRAPRYPEEEELARLNVQKARQDVMSPYALALQQMDEALGEIEGRLQRREISVAEADRLANLVRSNVGAALRGTSPWQIEQQRQNLASDVLRNQLSAGTSMASNLLSGLGSVYGNILSGHGAPAMDPLAMAKGFVQDLGGGPDMAALARAILAGALRPQQGW